MVPFFLGEVLHHLCGSRVFLKSSDVIFLLFALHTPCSSNFEMPNLDALGESPFLVCFLTLRQKEL